MNLSPRRREWQREALDDATQRWLAEDARYFLHQSLSTPCLDVLAACEGIYLEDLQGRRIMDFHGNSVHQVGFRNPRVVEAIKRQLDTLPFCTRRYTNLPAIQLAKKLAEVAPGRLNKVLFAPGGAEAMGIAMKLARVATGRFKTVSMWDSFHGASLDTISLGGETLFRQGIGPLLPGAEHVPPPNPTRCPFGCAGDCRLRCADYIDYVLEREGDVGAVIAEPIRSILATSPPEGYWQRVREICDRRGALLVFDEIPICLGRTGTLFACEGIGVTPDILVIGKGLGGGIVPMAAVIAREDLDVASGIALGHYTHEKSPLGAVAALATLETIEEEGLLAHAREMGSYALERLRAMQTDHPLIGDVRGVGLQIAVELVRQNGEPAIEEADAIMYAALRAGLSFKVTGGNVLALTPPLIITRAEMDQALRILSDCLPAARD
ncbi:MAG TPA: aspartate aminotransferase family protein [Chthonomonadaceae bacterium]|nr:aspartate aminotransferase family protein [Chthonomonadaceae bacterium]